MEKKKVKKVEGEQGSKDTLGAPYTSDKKKNVDNSAREAWMTMKDKKDANIGGYKTFGDSKTKSLGRAMQENATSVAADALVQKQTDAQMEALKERARKRAKK